MLGFTSICVGIYLYLCWPAQRSHVSVTVFFDMQAAVKHNLCGGLRVLGPTTLGFRVLDNTISCS